MRIGIMGHASLGGSSRIATELSVQLARRGHRVHLFTRTTPVISWKPTDRLVLHRSMEDDENDLHPSRLHADWSAREFDRFLSKLLEVIDDEGLDVLHFHYAIPFAFLAAALKSRLGDAAPVLIGTLHGTDVSILGREPRRHRSLVRSFRALDALTTVSFHHARLATQVFDLVTPPQVIPNFVDVSRFRPLGPLSLRGPIPDNGNSSGRLRPRLVHVSNFRPVKDPQSMARIFLDIREKIDAELWLIGDGPERAKVESIFEDKGVGADIRSWGLQLDVAPILAQTDLLLMTSLTENFSLATLEAMACGIPVLTTDVGGQSEVVVHGKTGFLFPLGDHGSAVALAVELLTDPIRYLAFSQSATAHASQFASRKVVPSYERLYRRMLENRSRGTDRQLMPAY